MNRRCYRRRMARIDWHKKGADPVWRSQAFGRTLTGIAAIFNPTRRRSDWRYPS